MYIVYVQYRKWYIMNANKLMAWLNNKSFMYIYEQVNEHQEDNLMNNEL